VGRANLYRLTVQTDLSRVCPVKPVQDLHERTFARAVLSQKGVDFAAVNLKIDMIIGQHARERFGNGPQGDSGG
jgi:hypothetical protein